MIVKRILVITIITTISAGYVYSQSPIISSNWMTHPDVVAIREVFTEIESRISDKEYDSVRAEQEYTQPYKDVLREAYFDSSGTLRKLTTSGGSGDSALTFHYYYDGEERLRFVFVLGGAVNGTAIEHRIYLNTESQKIWEIQTLIEGPGYSFPKIWPLDQLVLHPGDISLEEW
jgi:hypothetical protein